MSTVRVTLVLAGAALLAVGAWLLVLDSREGTVGPVLLWLAGAVAVHDLLLAPLVLLAGLALGLRPVRDVSGWYALGVRRAPRVQEAPGARGVWRGALVTAGCLTLVALPVLLRPGAPRNSSVLPLDYPRNWILALAGTALATLCVLLVRRVCGTRALRRQRKGRS